MTDDPKSTIPADEPGSVPICAIGASAGGVSALRSLFRLLPDRLGLAYVVVVHLAPDHASLLDEILASCTSMPVVKASDHLLILADHVYVIPPDRRLSIDGNALSVLPFDEPRSRRSPVDSFLRSVASARGDGIAVVLSGAGSDGSLGVRAVNAGGGIVMAQDPGEAEYDDMPRNAIATGVVDIVAPVAGLASRIAEVARSKVAVRSLDVGDGQDALRRVVGLLRTRSGHDFSGYKRATVTRRVLRRMQVVHAETFPAYEAVLRERPDEAGHLVRDLLISVTSFFRDGASFEVLDRLVIGPLLDEVGEAGLRVWVAGCATGEEAYGLVMLVQEEAARRRILLPLQVFATDLDEVALGVARDGRYARGIEADVSRERLRRFFVDDGSHYRIRKEVRDAVLFAHHSMLKDPPFTQLDLVSCRNVMIYFDRPLQQQITSVFHYALKPHGFLFLGPAESPDAAGDLFRPVSREARLYQALSVPHRRLPSLPQFGTADRLTTAHRSARVAQKEAQASSAALHAGALESSAAPSALVNDRGDLVHLSPNVGRYVLLSAGSPSINLSAIVRPELRLDLRNALARVFAKGGAVFTGARNVVLDGQPRPVALHVARLPRTEVESGQALVSFLEGEVGDGVPQGSDGDPGEVARLHIELRAVQDALASSQGERDLGQEDLRGANEELQSLNEEYRSTAEELETSKEELQSMNEELQTVNAELKGKLEAVSVAHGDLQNLTAATEVGTMFLDADLRLRMLAGPAAELFNVVQGDIGRPITNFTHKLRYADFERDMRAVLRELGPIEVELETMDGRWLLLRGRPYRSLEGRIDGVVVTFLDVSEVVVARQALRDVQDRHRALVESLAPLVWWADAEGRLTWVSPQWTAFTGLSEKASLGAGWLAAVHPDDREATVAAWSAARGGSVLSIEHRILAAADGAYRRFRSRATAVDRAADGSEWVGTSTDLDAPRRPAG